RLTHAWTATDNCAAVPTPANHATVGDSLGSASAYWTSWSFDPLGQRANQVQHSTTGGTDTTTTYTYNGNGAGQPHSLTGTTTTGPRYYQLPGGAVAVRTGTATTAYRFEVTDQHGTPAFYLDNTTQNPTWRQSTPYGDPRGTAGTWPDNRAFLNKPADAGTGL